VSDLPPGLEEFGERLAQAAERDVGEQRRGRLRWMTPRNIGLPVVAGLVAGAMSATAVSIVDSGGDPIEPERSGLQAPADPTVVRGTATDDPSGGPPWVVRAYTDAGGRECVDVGRLRDGVFGRVQRGRFRPLPTSGRRTCAAEGSSGPLVAVARFATVNLTLVFGLAVDRSTVSVTAGDVVQRVQPVGFGAFLTIFQGAKRRAFVVRSKVEGRTQADRFR
jgi:hypothetical protein